MKKYFLGIGVIMCGALVAFAALEDTVADNFINKANIVQNLCKAGKVYSLDRDLTSAIEGHKNHMTCLTNDAFMKWETEGEYETPKECEGSTIVEIQSLQRQRGIVSECNDKENVSYGVCRVTETLLAEFCAYDMYLWGKSFEDRIGDRISGDIQTEENYFLTEIAEEKRKSRRALRETIEIYRNYVRAKELSMTVREVNTRLRETSADFGKVSTGIGTFPDKFIPAPAPQCN